jgi:four helix bundle protein
MRIKLAATMGETYRDLKVWQSAVALAVDVYRLTKGFAREEIYGLSSQMRRSAVSIASNIAEGKGRFSQRELLQFLFRARGSLLELQTQIPIGFDLGYLDESGHKTTIALASETGRLLNGLIKAFQNNVESSEKLAI